MKTTNVTATLSSILLVIFMSVNSIANPVFKLSGDLTKSTIKKEISSEKKSISTTDDASEFSYLRFDVNNFIINSDFEEISHSSLDYLRFDVNNFVNSSDEITEMPASDFDYLRFDVNNYTSSTNSEITDLPSDNFSYLRFDVSKYSDNLGNGIEVLPSAE
jgi:hypothetical protein